uniref:Uncharacterized protein n=1 Tax=Pristionchus pacificus TaxID=54126 RepID=A0A2A6CUU6_PRIPA|eukprot:PDM81898.1 hypothetical protein PRIPAC_34052 [Pristionchus pacificus]
MLPSSSCCPWGFDEGLAWAFRRVSMVYGCGGEVPQPMKAANMKGFVDVSAISDESVGGKKKKKMNNDRLKGQQYKYLCE